MNNKDIEVRLGDKEDTIMELFNAIGEGIFFMDTDGILLAVNETGAKRFKGTVDELAGKCIYDVIPQELKEQKRKQIESVILSCKPLCTEDKFGEIYLRNIAYPVINPNGSVTKIASFSQDITENKRMEIAMRRLAAVVESSDAAIISKELDGTITSWNSAAERIYGYSALEITGKSVSIIVPPDYQNELSEMLSKIKNMEHIKNFETIRQRKDGKLINVSVTISPIVGANGKAIGASTIAHDITEHKKMEEALRESEERFRTAFEDAAIGMSLLSLDSRFMRVNRSLCDIVGYSEEELLSISTDAITHPNDLDIDKGYKRQLLNGEIPRYHMEKRYIHKLGNIIWISLSGSIVRDSGGKSLYFIVQVQDITKRKQAEEEAEKARKRAEFLANTDYLTGLLNRRAFMEGLKERFENAVNEGLALSLIIADIDFFKRVNDTYGHQIGDLVLQRFAGCLSDICRPLDLIGRYGGEEFIVCFPDTTCKQAEEIAEHMRMEVENLQINLPGGACIRITASFGIASTQLGYIKNIDSLIEQADTAMYKAKTSGRNRVCKVCGAEG